MKSKIFSVLADSYSQYSYLKVTDGKISVIWSEEIFSVEGAGRRRESYDLEKLEKITMDVVKLSEKPAWYCVEGVVE